MKDKFEKWMRNEENKLLSTASNYSRSIDRISKHYSEETGSYLDIYNETDLNLLKVIAKKYSLDGGYSDFGDYGNGTTRNAIAAYVRFMEFMEKEKGLEKLGKEGRPKDIQKLVYIIDNDKNKRNNWTGYIMEFHKAWFEEEKNNPVKSENKFIWGKRILINPNKTITEIFHEYRDKSILDFFNKNGKVFIEDIKEEDLIQIIFLNNLKFIDFKRIINQLFIRDEAIKIETNENEIAEVEDEIAITSLIYNSIDNIKNELGVFKDIIGHYDFTIAHLNKEINIRDEKLLKQEDTIDSLMIELENAENPLDELISIRENLKNIKGLLENDNLL